MLALGTTGVLFNRKERLCCENHVRALQTFKTKETNKIKASHYNLDSHELPPSQVSNTEHNCRGNNSYKNNPDN